MKTLYILFTAVLIFTGCESYEEEYNQLKGENEQLKEESQDLSARIDSLKNTPAYMIGQAHEEFQLGDYKEAEKILFNIQSQHPEWNKRLVLQYIGEIRTLIERGTRMPE